MTVEPPISAVEITVPTSQGRLKPLWVYQSQASALLTQAGLVDDVTRLDPWAILMVTGGRERGMIPDARSRMGPMIPLHEVLNMLKIQSHCLVEHA